MAKRKASDSSGLRAREVEGCLDSGGVVLSKGRNVAATVGRPTGEGPAEGVQTNRGLAQGSDVALTGGAAPAGTKGVATTYCANPVANVANAGDVTLGNRRQGTTIEVPTGKAEASEEDLDDPHLFFRLLRQVGYETW